MMLTLPALPPTIRPLLDTESDRLKWYPVPQQNGLADCLTCRGAKIFRWYADPTAQVDEGIVDYQCNCREQYWLSRFLFASGLGPAQVRMCWGDTQFADPRDQAALLAYTAEFEGSLRYGRGLFMCAPDGTPEEHNHGNGKSMFAALLLKRAAALGSKSWFTTFADMLDAYTAAWTDKTKREWFDKVVRTSQLLVIDDIGKEHPKFTVAKPALDSVFRSRVQGGLTTIITTNLDRQTFKIKYESALSSLVDEACQVVEFYGPDFRNQHAIRRQREIQLGLSRPWALG